MPRTHADDLEGVNARCRCGVDAARGSHRLGCLECGAPCCVACAITLESVAYCRYCAATLLGTTASSLGGRFEVC